jgi:excisionase family DNA binding protein
MTSDERWLSVEDIAAHLGISKETVYRWLEKRRIPAHRVGKLWKFKTSEVDRWVMDGGADSAAPARRLNAKMKRTGKGA